jgi:hypothetical protein
MQGRNHFLRVFRLVGPLSGGPENRKAVKLQSPHKSKHRSDVRGPSLETALRSRAKNGGKHFQIHRNKQSLDLDPGTQQTFQIQAPSRNQFKGFIIHSGIREVNGPARCAHEPWGYTAVRSTFGASSPRSTAKAPAMLFGTDIWSQPIVLVPGGPLPFCTRCRVQHEPRTQMHLWRCYHCIHCGVVMCGECYLPHIWHFGELDFSPKVTGRPCVCFVVFDLFWLDCLLPLPSNVYFALLVRFLLLSVGL